MSLQDTIKTQRHRIRDYGMYVAFAVIVAIFAVATKGLFVSPRNIGNLVNATSYIAVLAVGMTLVIVIRHIDLSVGFLAGVLGAIAALSDPLARGDDLLGLGQHWVSFGFLSQSQAVWRIWMAQFALILGAHLIAVLLAEQGLRRAGLRPGLRAQLPMTLLMVLYTCFGLWLLASPSIG